MNSLEIETTLATEFPPLCLIDLIKLLIKRNWTPLSYILKEWLYESCVISECVPSYYGKFSIVTQSTCRTEYLDVLTLSMSFSSPVIIALLLSIAQGIRTSWKNKTAWPKTNL